MSNRTQMERWLYDHGTNCRALSPHAGIASTTLYTIARGMRPGKDHIEKIIAGLKAMGLEVTVADLWGEK